MMRFSSNVAPMKLATVHKGNMFEERSMKILQDNLSMSLRRVGGKSDGGVDLMGWWWLPPTAPPTQSFSAAADHLSRRRRLRVLAQCKAEKKKTGPNYVRELEGVMHRHMPLGANSSSSGSESLVALLVSESPFTKSTLLRAHSSPLPFFLLHIPPVDGSEEVNQIGTAVWNPALAGENGLLQGKMEVRWERSLTGAGRPGLWWDGHRVRSWTPDDQPLVDNE